MRLLIDGGGYATAATAFADANHTAAIQYDVLTGKLSGLGAMAGDDATSTEFAAAYDGAAADAVGAHADLVAALANLGRLTEQSLANHADANVRSMIAGAVVYEGVALPDHGYVSVLPSSPPSSVGGDPPSLGYLENLVLDHVEGFVWPNADVDRLRDAAHVWRLAAESLDQLTDYCDGAVRGFDAQRSPEIPLAIAATDRMRATVRDLADQYAALAATCETYAASVEAAHARTRALVAALVQIAAEGVILGGLITLASSGLGAGAGAGLVGARVAAKAPEFRALLVALKAETAGTAATVRATGARLQAIRAKLDDFLGIPKGAAGERGAITVTMGSRWHKGWLRTHEHSGSHSIERHVARSVSGLQERLSKFPHLPYASSFESEQNAERVLSRFLMSRWDEITTWMRDPSTPLRLDGRLEEVTGISVTSDAQVLKVTGIRAVLVPDNSMPDGWRILTSFPQP